MKTEYNSSISVCRRASQLFHWLYALSNSAQTEATFLK